MCDADYYAEVGVAVPECVKCPRAALCGGGCMFRGMPEAHYSCSEGPGLVGEWVLNSASGRFELVSCPSGYELRTKSEQSEELQECHKCLQSEYILDPSSDACQPCPPGLRCNGNAEVEPVVLNSTWVRDGSFWRLQDCPAGYRVWPSLSAVQNFDAALQKCDPCQKGEECTTPPCTECAPCQPGFYKAFIGVYACQKCLKDTYRETPGAQEQSACLSCPVDATTGGMEAMVNLDACQCKPGFYSFRTDTAFLCHRCPFGAEVLCRVSSTDPPFEHEWGICRRFPVFDLTGNCLHLTIVTGLHESSLCV